MGNTMKTKRKNPYTILLDEIKAWIRKMKYRHTVSMFYWSLENLKPGKVWRLDDVYQRTLAAQSLGYEVVIQADENGMTMKYKEKIETPWLWEN